ncbi:MAG: hypothetical protein ACRC6G_01410 [Deefgea sp.]
MLFIILLSLLAILAGLIYAYRKLPRRYFVFLIVLLLACPFITFKVYERDFMFSFVPDALQVESITYQKEESWGFGPGAHETAIRIYPLPDVIAHLIAEQGLEFFTQMPANHNQNSRDWRGQYSNWSETPIQDSSRWQSDKKTRRFNINDYLCTYGFCIDIQPAVLEEANTIINSPGSYYAYGRIGLIIVSPSNKQVLYIYNG